MTSPDADNSSPSTGASNTIDSRASENQNTALADRTYALDQNERIDVSKHVTGDVPHVDTDINSNGKPGERESRLTHASNPEYFTYGMIRQPRDDNGGESLPCGYSGSQTKRNERKRNRTKHNREKTSDENVTDDLAPKFI